MKLIIDIPKGEYDKICKTMLHTSSGNPNFYFESKIANGIPLEQIRDAIEREADYQDAYVDADVAKGMYMALEMIDKHTK